jgi:hypothetical protein
MTESGIRIIFEPIGLSTNWSVSSVDKPQPQVDLGPVKGRIVRSINHNIKVVITRDDTIEAFGAYCSPSIKEEKQGLVLLNVFASFCAAIEEGESPARIIIETIMHEVGHALEEYFGREFNEDMIEEIVEQYKGKYKFNTPTPEEIQPSDACVDQQPAGDGSQATVC